MANLFQDILDTPVYTLNYTLDTLHEAVSLLKKQMQTCAVLTFTGDLGAGKTTLVQELLAECGVQEAVTSPTYAYLNVHENQRGETFCHFDLYRIDSLGEFRAAGFYDYIYQEGSWALIEWPEPILSILDHAVCHVTIMYGSDLGSRVLQLRVIK